MAYIGRLARRLVLLTFVPLLGGCDDGSGCPDTCTDLREFLGGSMTVTVWPDVAMTRWQVRVDLVRPPGVVNPLDCHPLPAGTGATFNGAAMEVQGLGGYNHGFVETCTQPRFFRTEPFDRRGGGTIAIDDGRFMFEVYMPHVLEPQQFRLAAPADGVLRAGNDVVIEHAPAGDTLVSNVPQVTIDARPIDNWYGPLTAVVDGSTVRFLVPENHFRAGTWPVKIDFAPEVIPEIERFHATAPGRPRISYGTKYASLPATLVTP